MELQADVATMAKSRRPGLAVGERFAARRHAQLLVVPVKPWSGRNLPDALGELEPADLRLGCGRDAASQRDRQRLSAEAQPEHRKLRGDRFAQQLDLRGDPDPK